MVKWRIGGWIRQGNIGEEKKAAVSGSARRKIMDGPMLCRMDGDHVRADEAIGAGHRDRVALGETRHAGWCSRGSRRTRSTRDLVARGFSVRFWGESVCDFVRP